MNKYREYNNSFMQYSKFNPYTMYLEIYYGLKKEFITFLFDYICEKNLLKNFIAKILICIEMKNNMKITIYFIPKQYKVTLNIQHI